MKNEEIVKELNTIRELVDFGRYSPAIHNIRILVEKLQRTKDEPEEKYKCKNCGGEINKGEFDTFGVCDGCWDRPEEKVYGPQKCKDAAESKLKFGDVAGSKKELRR